MIIHRVFTAGLKTLGFTWFAADIHRHTIGICEMPSFAHVKFANRTVMKTRRSSACYCLSCACQSCIKLPKEKPTAHAWQDRAAGQKGSAWRELNVNAVHNKTRYHMRRSHNCNGVYTIPRHIKKITLSGITIKPVVSSQIHAGGQKFQQVASWSAALLNAHAHGGPNAHGGPKMELCLYLDGTCWHLISGATGWHLFPCPWRAEEILCHHHGRSAAGSQGSPSGLLMYYHDDGESTMELCNHHGRCQHLIRGAAVWRGSRTKRPVIHAHAHEGFKKELCHHHGRSAACRQGACAKWPISHSHAHGESKKDICHRHGISPKNPLEIVIYLSSLYASEYVYFSFRIVM